MNHTMNTNTYGSPEHKKNLENYIFRNQGKERKVSYDISAIDRENLIEGYKECIRIGCPMNTLLQFDISYRDYNPIDAVEVIRKIAHKYRMFMMQHEHLPTYLAWSRFRPVDSDYEVGTMMMYVKPEHFKVFKELAQEWNNLQCTVYQVTDTKEFEVENGRMVSALDILLKAASPASIRRDSTIYHESSDIIFRPRLFSSVKLERQRLIHSWQKRRAAIKAVKQQERLPTIEDVVVDILKSKGL